MLAVQKQHGKHLVGTLADVQLHVFTHRGRGIEHSALSQLLCGGTPGQLQHCQQLGPFGRAQAFDAFQILRGGVQEPGDAVKTGAVAIFLGQFEQFLCHVQHVLALDAGAQQQRQ